MNPLIGIFFIPITYLPDIILVLLGKIISLSLMGIKGLKREGKWHLIVLLLILDEIGVH